MEKWYCKGTALLEQIQQTHTEEDNLALWFIGQTGFILKHRGKTLMIDPVLNDIPGADGSSMRQYAPPFLPEEAAPDYILCTHGHIDHLAESTVCGILCTNSKTKLILPEGCRAPALSYGIPEDRMLCMLPGDLLCPEDGIRIRALSAAHPVHVSDASDSGMALCYALDLDGIRVTHMGDTYLTQPLLQNLEALPAPHIFLPPINGDDLFRAMQDCIGNMNAEEAAALAVRLQADLTIPTHYDMIRGNTVDPLRFAGELRRLSPTAKWHIPALGERFLYQR